MSHSKLGASSNQLTAQAAESPVWDGTTKTAFTKGNGTESNPYLIGTGAELAYLAQQVNAGTAYQNVYFKLTADIVLNNTSDWETWSDTKKPTNSWTPIGYFSNDYKTKRPFNGTFDGDGHTVSGIYVSSNTTYSQGLFGVVGNATGTTAVVKNVGVINSYIGKGLVGGVVGFNYNTVINCYNAGNVKGTSAGGVVGANGGTVINCYNHGNVTGEMAGGIVETNSINASMFNCYNAGNVKGTSAGGVAEGNGGAIENCYYLSTTLINSRLEISVTVIGFDSRLMFNSKFNAKGELATRPTVGSNNYSYLLEALNAYKDYYNTNNPTAVQAIKWYTGVDETSPTFKLSLKIDGFNIYASGLAITLKAGTTTGYTNIYSDEDLANPIILTGPTGNTTTGYDLSKYTVYGGGTTPITGNTSITMTGGKVTSINGGGNGAAATVSGNASITISGGTETLADAAKITGNVVAGGTETSVSTVTGTKTVNIGGTPIIGTLAVVDGGGAITTPATGIIINNIAGDTATTPVANGVDTVTVNGDFDFWNSQIYLILPKDFKPRTVATKETQFISQNITNFKIFGEGATNKKHEINTTDAKKLDVVPNITYLPRPYAAAGTSLTYAGTNQKDALKGLITGLDPATMTITMSKGGVDVSEAIDVGTYTIKADILNKALYRWEGETSESLAATIGTSITAKPVTIIDLPTTKVYDGSKDVDISGAKLDGVIAGDTANVTLVNTGVTAAVANATAENNKPLTITGTYSLTGAKATNYALTQPSNLKINITPREIAAVWANTELTYTGSPQLPTATALTGVAGETVVLTVTETGSGDGISAGAQNATATINPANGNYTLTNATTAYTIAKAPIDRPTVSGTLTYNAAEQLSGLTLGDNSAGYTISGEIVGTNAKTYTATATLDANHKWSTGDNEAAKLAVHNIDWTIGKKTLTVTPKAGAALTKVYNGNTTYDTSAIAYDTNYTLDKFGNDDVKLTISSATFDSKDVTTATTVTIAYSDVLTGNAASNYSVVAASFGNGATITAKSIAITIEDKTSGFGVTLAPLTWKDGGNAIEKPDGTNLDDLKIVLAKADGKAVGTYNITGTHTNTNYTVTFKNKDNTQAYGVYTITKATIARPTWSGSLTYNGAEQQSGLTDGTGYKIGGVNTGTNAATYTATATLDGDHEWSDGTATEVHNINWTIAPKKLSEVTIADIEVLTYTAAAHTPTPEVSWTPTGGSKVVLTTGTDFTFSYTNNTNASATAKVTITAVNNSNYTGNNSKDFTINKANIATTDFGTPSAIFYGDTLSESTFKTTVLNGIAGAYSWTTPDAVTAITVATDGATVSKNATFTPTSSNYNVATKDVAVTVKFRTLMGIQAFAAITDKEYGTAQADLGLPTKTDLLVEKLESDSVDYVAEAGITWSGYNPLTINKQRLTGTLTLPAGVKHSASELNEYIDVTLKSKTPGAVTYAAKSAEYNGSPITHEITLPIEGVASIAYKYVGKNTTVYAENTIAPTNAGTYSVTATFTMEGGYLPIAATTADLTITPLEATLLWATPESLDLVYSGKAKVPTVTVSNLVKQGDVIDTCAVTAAVTSGDNTNVSATGDPFIFTASVLGNPNYALPAEKASPSYIITPKTLTNIKAEKEFAEGEVAFSLKLSDKNCVGFIVGDDLTIKFNTSEANKGTYTGAKIKGLNRSGADIANYSFTEADITAKITGKKLPEITLSVTGSTYTGAKQESTVTIAGTTEYNVSWEYAVDGSTFVSGSGTPAFTNAGTYRVTATGTGNYADSTQTALYVIKKKAVTLKWTAPDLAYTGLAKAPTVVVEGTVSGDACPVTVSLTTPDSNINVGSFTYKATALDNPNYELSGELVSPSYTITKAIDNVLTTPLTITDIYVGGTLAPNAAPKFGDVVYTYYKDNGGAKGEIIGTTAPTEIGAYWVTAQVADHTNYNAIAETDAVKFNINQKPASGGGSEPSISAEDIFWMGTVSDIKFKTESVVEKNCSYDKIPKNVLLELQAVDKTLNLNMNGEKLSITSKEIKDLTFDKASYSIAELKALIEVPEVIPTPTPTPTEKPTEPTDPTEPTAKKCWLCGACPMFLGICLWIWLAIAIVVVTVVIIIIVKKKKKDDEENEDDVKNKKE